MRILVLEENPSSRAGGAERSMRDFNIYLAKANDVHLGYVRCGDYVEDPELSDLYAGTVRLKLANFTFAHPCLFVSDLLKLQLYIRTHRIDRVITHMVHVSPLLRLLQQLVDVPFSIYFKWTGSMEDVGRKVHLGNAGVDSAAAVCRFVADYWIRNGVPNKKIEVVPEGIDIAGLPKSDHKKRSGCIIGFAGRIVPEKGLEDLIRSMLIVHQRFANVTLRVAGAFPETAAGKRYKSQLSSLIKDLDLSARVMIDGFVAPLEPWLTELDMTVVPSICNDAQPLVMMQSMAVATPVIATAVGGIPEVMGSSFREMLVEPGDPEALATRIWQIRRRAAKNWFDDGQTLL